MQVPRGAIVRYTGVWPRVHGSWWCGVVCQPTVASIVSRVGNNLSAWGLTVVVSDYDDSINPFADTINVALSLRVDGAGFGDQQDIVSIVRGEVYNIEGDFPLADSVTYVQPSPSEAPVGTGQPDNSPSASQPTDIGKVLKEITGNTQLVVVGLGLGLLTALILIARPRSA